MLNHITIMGRLTARPELKTTPSGAPVTNFTLAVERDFKDKTTGKKPVDFIDCVAWHGTAEFVTRYFDKGRMAVADGRLQFREYTDNNGIKRRSAEVLTDSVYFADSATGGNSQQSEPAQTVPQYEELKDDEDLPF